MTIGLYVGTTENDETMEGLFDADFTENEEYFREDTLRLGFKSEAQRVIQENKKDDGTYDIDSIISIAFSDTDYYQLVESKITKIGDIEVISVACKC